MPVLWLAARPLDRAYQRQDFTATLSPYNANNAPTLAQGGAQTFTISTAGINGFIGNIALNYVIGSPQCQLSNLTLPPPVAAGSAASVTLTMTQSFVGYCLFQISASANGDTHLLNGWLDVISSQNFTMTLPASQGTLTAIPTTQAAQVTFNPTLTAINGFCNNVSFQVTGGLPAGASYSAPQVYVCGSSPQTAQITITVPPGSPQCTSQLAIDAYGVPAGSSQDVNQYITPILQVGSGGSTFSISASPPQTTAPGGTAQYTITVSGSSGLGNVTLTATGGPPGSTIQLVSASVPVGQQTQMTVTAPSNAGLGTYPINLTGMLGTVLKYTTALTNIAQAAAASIISPVPGQISSGQSTFTWNSGIGATQYTLAVGSSAGATDIYSANLGSGQSATVNIPSGASVAYVTLNSLTPIGWLAQSYVYGVPSILANTAVSLGSISVQPNAPPVSISSPLPNDTITGCSVPAGVTAVIAGAPGSQTVTFRASSAAQYGATNIACSTAASMTLRAVADIVGDADGTNYLRAEQTGPGMYHVSISGYGFGNDDDGGGSVYVGGGATLVDISGWRDDQVDIDILAPDGVCGNYPIEIDPDDPDDLAIDGFGPESLETEVGLCPDVPTPTYTISGQVTSTVTGAPLQGVTVSRTSSNCNGIILAQQTDPGGMYDYVVNAGCSSILTAGGATYLNYFFTPGVVSVPNLSSDAIADLAGTPIKTVFLLHGIGQSPADMQNLANNLTGPLGIDPTRYRVDAGYSFADCAAVGNSGCPSSCGIPNGAQRLATYIANAAPPGDIILVGFSLGGLIARDLILNNYGGILSGRKVTLVTLGTPSLGYPYISSVDDLAFYPYLVQAMSGNWQALQSNNWPLLSTYLSPATQSWQAGSFPGASGFWLAAYGQSCSQPIRSPNPSVIATGCSYSSPATIPTRSPTSDGVVCADSAGYNISTPTGIGPSLTWSDPTGTYVHSNAGAGLATAFLLCGNPSNANLLSAPPATGGLFESIVAVINGR